MARPEIDNPREQRICAVRLPGTSRARFADARDLDIALGSWVVVRTSAGEEAGHIVVAPDQWLSPVTREDAVPVLRALSAAEMEVLAGRVEEARALVDRAAEVLRHEAQDAFLSGLRFTLDGDTAVVSVVGPLPTDTAALTRALEASLDTRVTLEQEHSGSPDRFFLSGGPGRIPDQRPETFRELLERRFDVFQNPESFAPQGLPRLGSLVKTEQGSGQLVAVDIRHWRATVRLDAGEHVDVSVDDLSKPD